MDTRYWGPSGWRLLHLIAASPYANSNRQFWEMLPYVLPCKFCRSSLTIYYASYPIPTKLSEFPKWLYIIHNCVNDKLRDQGQDVPQNPPMKSILEYYSNYYKQGCTKTLFPGWEFLFSIADNHPSGSPSKPMPDTPDGFIPTTLEEKNRYNLLTTEERIECLRIFWSTLPSILPFEEWRTSWRSYTGPLTKAIQHRKSAMSWLWTIRCGLESDLEQLGETNFYGLCKEVAAYRSGCSTSKRAKTCRSIRHGKTRTSKARKTRSHKQR